MNIPPFWPRTSPHFMRVRVAVRRGLDRLHNPVEVFVGLSGGPDSLALTAALCAETRTASTKVIALCIDHGLQAGSFAVSQRAAIQAKKWGADARVIQVGIGKQAIGKQCPGGLEAGARRARYAGFAQHTDAVMVAHTAEDQAENLLLSSLRGHATGMNFESVVEGVRVIRPLLAIRRADTVGACWELGADVWCDPHNEREDFRRVAIRKRVLPLLEDIHGGDVVAALADAASDIAADDTALLALAPTDIDVELDCEELNDMVEPVRKRMIARWLTFHDAAPTRASLAAIDALICAWNGQGSVAVGDGSAKNPGARLEVQRVGGKLRLLRF